MRMVIPSAPGVVQAPVAAAARLAVPCPRSHALRPLALTSAGGRCGICDGGVERGALVLCCERCAFRVCALCHQAPGPCPGMCNATHAPTATACLTTVGAPLPPPAPTPPQLHVFRAARGSTPPPRRVRISTPPLLARSVSQSTSQPLGGCGLYPASCSAGAALIPPPSPCPGSAVGSDASPPVASRSDRAAPPPQPLLPFPSRRAEVAPQVAGRQTFEGVPSGGMAVSLTPPPASSEPLPHGPLPLVGEDAHGLPRPFSAAAGGAAAGAAAKGAAAASAALAQAISRDRSPHAGAAGSSHERRGCSGGDAGGYARLEERLESMRRAMAAMEAQGESLFRTALAVEEECRRLEAPGTASTTRTVASPLAFEGVPHSSPARRPPPSPAAAVPPPAVATPGSGGGVGPDLGLLGPLGSDSPRGSPRTQWRQLAGVLGS